MSSIEFEDDDQIDKKREIDRRLIRVVKMFPLLYNRMDPDYKSNTRKKDMAWEAVSYSVKRDSLFT